MSITRDTAEQVPFRIFDFSSPDEQLQAAGLETGFYYDIPMPEDEKSAPGEVFLRGPYPTADRAKSEALDFIKDALAQQEAA